MSPLSNSRRLVTLVKWCGTALLAAIAVPLLLDDRVASNEAAHEQQYSLGWIILGSAVFFWIISSCYEWKTSTRSVSQGQGRTLPRPPSDSYVLTLPKLYDERRRRQSFVYLAAFVLISSVAGYLYSALAATAERTGHSGFLLVLTGAIVVLLLIGVGVLTSYERRLLALSQGDTPRLEISPLGIGVSGLLVTDPARWRILDSGKAELFIPWQDVLQIDVTQGSGGTMPPQYLLYVVGSSAKFGRGAVGVGAGLPAPQFGIIRTHLSKADAQVRLALERFATCPIRIRE